MARREVDEWFWQVGNDLQRLSEEISRSGPSLSSRKFWEPKIDLLEDTQRYILRVEIAGVRGEDVQLLYLPDRHSVLIRGVRKEEEFLDSDRTGCHQLEIYYGEFEREVRLPDQPVDPRLIKAQFRSGVLFVVIPKAEITFTHTKISIRKV